MHNKWLHCFVAVICTGATACQKDPDPAPAAAPETVTQSAKPAEPTAAAKPTEATPTALNAEAKLDQPAGEAAPAGETSALKVGDAAPPLTLTLQNGKTVALNSLQGKQIVVYFYPKDDTPGCTVEAQGIRDQWQAFEKAGVQVFGVSMQDAASHTAFIDKHKLPFDLVVDGDGSVTKAFGVPVKGGEYAARHSFLIGSDGKIKQVWRDVAPAEHAKELLEAAGVSAAPAAPSTATTPKAG
jgi:thioredoxin-dependent peroxiredoxin